MIMGMPTMAPPTLRDVFETHGPRLHRVFRYLGVRENDLPDAVQDAFLVVHRKIGEFEGRSSLETWLYGIALRVAASYRRRAHVRREKLVSDVPTTALDPTQETAAASGQMRDHLLRSLARLDDDKRTVFVLFEIEERPMTEVAEIVGCPRRTAYARLDAARAAVLADWSRVTGVTP